MSNIKFVGLHAHSGVGSPFDGFGYPQDHMDFALDNGCKALALTDHGNMNGTAYQVLHAKKMEKEGKDFKPVYGEQAGEQAGEQTKRKPALYPKISPAQTLKPKANLRVQALNSIDRDT